MALGALAAPRALARGLRSLQSVAIGGSDFGDRRIHFRKQRGLLRSALGKRAQARAMGQECGQRGVSGTLHDSGLTATPLSQPMSLPRPKPATAAPSAIARKCAPLSHRVRSASHPSK